MEKKEIEKEWVGMPEFVQEKKDCFSKIIVRSETEEDLKDFAAKITGVSTSNFSFLFR